MKQSVCVILTGFLFITLTPAGHTEPTPFELLGYFVGGVEFYIETASVQNENGLLTFNVIGVSPEDKRTGSHSRYLNRIDCKTGTYQRAYARQDVRPNSVPRPMTFTSGRTPVPMQTMTLREDGQFLYYKLRDLCERESGLSQNEYHWLADQSHPRRYTQRW